MAANQTPRAPTDADPAIPPKEAPSKIPKSIHLEGREARLRRIRENLRLRDPPAVPSAAHDEGLRALGLLDFVRLNLPSSGAPRPDLVAEFIANYKPYPYPGWSSSVRGQKIVVFLHSFAEALCLPAGSPTMSFPASTVVASAARQFMKVYILAPMHTSTGMKRRLPCAVDCALSSVQGHRAHYVDWTELLWYQVEDEMEHLIKSLFGSTPLHNSAPEAGGAAPNATTPQSRKSGAEPIAVQSGGVAKTELRTTPQVLTSVKPARCVLGASNPEYGVELAAKQVVNSRFAVGSQQSRSGEWSQGFDGVEGIRTSSKKSTNRACYYGAYLQRLIWVVRPDLFQLPPEPSVIDAPPQPAALRPHKERGSIRSTVNKNQKLCSEARSEKIEATTVLKAFLSGSERGSSGPWLTRT